MNKKKILLIAVDDSADNIAYELIKDLQANFPNKYLISAFACNFVEKLKIDNFYKVENLNKFGPLSYLASIFNALTKIKLIKKFINENPHDMIIMIDGWGFMNALAKSIQDKREGCIFIKYVAPQFWATRKERIHKLAANFDYLFSILKFEEAETKKYIKTFFAGNPICKDKALTATCNAKISKDNNLISLIPGSRIGEIKKMLPIYLGVAKKLCKDFPQIKFVIPTINSNQKLINEITDDFIKKNNFKNKISFAHEDKRFAEIKKSIFSIATSGTVSSQIAMLQTAMLICYKLDFVSEFLIKKISYVKYCTLLNIVAGKEIIPELLAKDANIDNIYDVASHFLVNDQLIKKQIEEVSLYTDELGINIKNSAYKNPSPAKKIDEILNG